MEDTFLKAAFQRSMQELNNFYEINWTEDIPKIRILPDRESIDVLKGKQTEPWVVGWSNKNAVFLLDSKNYETESNHKYNEAEYVALLTHELSHCFFRKLSGVQHGKPVWLNEGVAIYTSGQNRFKDRPNKLESFLDYDETGGPGVYREAGFAIELLVKRFGKEKLFALIKSLRAIKSAEEFRAKFRELYDFEPTYDSFNSMPRVTFEM